MSANGLYIGKLAPMHRGHAMIIERALLECDRVCIFIYNSKEFDEAHPLLPKVLRGYWVWNAYPEADVVLGYNPPPDEPGYEGDRKHAEYISKLIPYTVDAVYGGEEWVDTFAELLGAESRRGERDGRGISATKVRQNPHKYAWYMRPEVRDYMLIHYPNDEDLTI